MVQKIAATNYSGRSCTKLVFWFLGISTLFVQSPAILGGFFAVDNDDPPPPHKSRGSVVSRMKDFSCLYSQNKNIMTINIPQLATQLVIKKTFHCSFLSPFYTNKVKVRFSL